jgi:hypothetical protein
MNQELYGTEALCQLNNKRCQYITDQTKIDNIILVNHILRCVLSIINKMSRDCENKDLIICKHILIMIHELSRDYDSKPPAKNPSSV